MAKAGGENLTNEELVIRIKGGERELVPELWEQVHKLLLFWLHRLLEGNTANKERAIRAGVTLDDLEQETYFALLDAIKAYDPATGFRFSSYIKFSVMKHFYKAIGMRTVHQRGEPLSRAASTDEELTDDGFSLSDQISDPEAEKQLENVLESIYLKDLHEALEACLKELPKQAEAVIRYRYYDNKTLEEIGATCSLSGERIRQIESQALDEMAEMQRLRAHREDIIAENIYKGGFRQFKNTRTSSVERTVEKLERFEERENAVAEFFHRSIDWAAIRAKR
jgi:RNA polymerase sigma factor (sigma-70 family)